MPADRLNISSQNLANLELDVQYVPQEGPKAIPVLLDFTQANNYDLDLQLIGQQGRISMVQTLFVDMSASDIAMTVSVNGSLQQIVCKGRTQGYYQVLCPTPVKLSFSCAGGPAGVKVYLVNVAIPGAVWPTL